MNIKKCGEEGTFINTNNPKILMWLRRRSCVQGSQWSLVSSHWSSVIVIFKQIIHQYKYHSDKLMNFLANSKK